MSFPDTVARTAPIDIMLVEDNEGDVVLTREALDDSGLSHTLRVMADGELALAQLRSDAAAGRLPDLVLLDVSLPDQSGHDVLGVIKSDESLESLPVVILSGSQDDDDVRTAYKRHVSCYVAKPRGFAGYTTAVQKIQEFWAVTARLPGRS